MSALPSRVEGPVWQAMMSLGHGRRYAHNRWGGIDIELGPELLGDLEPNTLRIAREDPDAGAELYVFASNLLLFEAKLIGSADSVAAAVKAIAGRWLR